VITLRLFCAFLLLAVAVGCGSAAPPGGTVGPPPTSSAGSLPTIVPTPTPSASSGLVLTKTFASTRNAFSVGYPDDATIVPAIATWTPATPAEGYDAFDFVKSKHGGVFRAASAGAPSGVPVDGWIEEFITPSDGSRCGPARSQLPVIVVDGATGRVRAGCDEVEATVAIGQRVYLFTLFNESPDARRIFDAFAATIDLRP
jgi:hypothetical protein